MISLLLALLLSAPVAAQDGGIQRVKAGSKITAAQDGWLLPDDYYDECLVKATQLRVVQGVADQCIDEASEQLKPIQSALMEAQERIVLDGQQIGNLEAQLAVRDQSIEDLRRQRNTAFGVAGGSVLTVAAGVVVAVLVSR